MQNDETLWECINGGFCSFKVKVKQPKATFCRNVYNVTGSCNRVSCPLANSKYATVREQEGVCYLFIKTAERAHSPKNMWEKIKLKKNLQEAFEQIQTQLQYWPDHRINRCKARLIKLHQMIMRQRKMVLAGGPKLVPIKQKTERREATREQKAEVAAKVPLAIEKALIHRLKTGVYGSLYNVDENMFKQMLDKEEEEGQTEQDELNEYDDEEVSEDENIPDQTFVENFDESDSEDMDMEDIAMEEIASGSDRKRKKLEIEYEMEDKPSKKKMLN